MTRVVMHGCNGHMGRVITDLCKADADISIVAGVDKFKGVENEYPVFDSIQEVDVDYDVIIDFSVPKATLNILEYASKENVPVVIATTGFNAEENKKIEEYSKSGPILKSANMSFDVIMMKNLWIKILKDL